MGRNASRPPLQVFEENIQDAHQLLALARILANTRTRAMRRERRERVGAALGIPRKNWAAIDGAESTDLFIVIKPGATITRHRFEEVEMQPLLRQAVVAISAAVETYVADKACTYVGRALAEPGPRMKQLSISLGEVLEIDGRYKRRGWGYRDVVLTHVRREASPAPIRIGELFSLVGRPLRWDRLDAARKVPKGSCDADLRRLYDRRNRIAHQADRTGGRKARITIGEVETFMENARAIVEAIDAQIAAQSP
jgi:hypothetical protein